MNLLNASVLTSFLFLSAVSSQAEMRDFTNIKGVVIKGELKKAKGQMIFLRKDDNKEISVPLNQFSKDDQTFILKWMTEDPLAIDYNFAVKAEEKMAPASKKSNNSGYYEKISVMQKNYTISIQNSSRNTLDELSIDWCAFMMNNVSFSGSGSRYGTYNSGNDNGELRFKHGTLEVAQMPASHSATIVTPTFTVESVIDKYYTGAKTKDKLQGVWLRFYRGETLVYEWKTPDCPKTDWPAGEHKVKLKGEIAKESTSSKIPQNTSTRRDTPPAGETSTSSNTDEDMGEIIKIFQLEDAKTGK